MEGKNTIADSVVEKIRGILFDKIDELMDCRFEIQDGGLLLFVEMYFADDKLNKDNIDVALNISSSVLNEFVADRSDGYSWSVVAYCKGNALNSKLGGWVK